MEALGLLAGGVAHDLNNILSGIVSYPQLILMSEDLPSAYREAIETIYESGLRAAAIVEDLLTLAKGVASHKEPINLNLLVNKYLQSPEHEKLVNLYPDALVEVSLVGRGTHRFPQDCLRLLEEKK